MIKAILFDLDGTLLPMDQDVFLKAYLGSLVRELVPRGYEQRGLVDAVWRGTGAMVTNNGEMTNEDRWWQTFCSIYGEDARKEEEPLRWFYESRFDEVRLSCGYTPRAKATIELCKARGLRTILATNPVFPAVATKARIRWAGLDWSDFELVTTYENARYCKPNVNYYREILDKIGLSGEECVMVGNDVSDDMVAGELGIKLFLLTDNLINKNGVDIDAFEHGSYDDLYAFISNLNKEGV